MCALGQVPLAAKDPEARTGRERRPASRTVWDGRPGQVTPSGIRTRTGNAPVPPPPPSPPRRPQPRSSAWSPARARGQTAGNRAAPHCHPRPAPTVTPPPLPIRAHRRPLAPHRAPACPARALPAPSPCEQRGGRPGGASAVPPGAPRGQTPPSLRSCRKDQLGPRNNAHERGLAPRGRISAFWGAGSFPAHWEKPGGSAEGFLGEVRPGDPVGRKDRPLSMALNSCPWAASDCKPKPDRRKRHLAARHSRLVLTPVTRLSV